jgi:Arc/MetJ-type ribon-helix-helix transcriptional regulator
MVSKKNEPITRINFELKGPLAQWVLDMKAKNYFTSNPEIVRQAIRLLRDSFSADEEKMLKLKD